MAENRISYLDRTYDEYRSDIITICQQYYYDIFTSYNDASIGQWLIDVTADIADNLSYNIDRAYQETDIDGCTSREALLAIARTNGCRIGGPKCAIVEVELACQIPMNVGNVVDGGNTLANADESYCPYVRRGTQFSDGRTTFELVDDVDFKSQFDANGISDRQIFPNRDGNGSIIGYTYKKLAIAVAGTTRIFKKTITSAEIEPFMSITLKDESVTNVESIILKQGNVVSRDPNIGEFYVDQEAYFDKQGLPVQRYFEVDNLVEQYRFGYVIDESCVRFSDGNTFAQATDGSAMNGMTGYYNPVWQEIEEFELTDENGNTVYDANGNPVTEVVRVAMQGEWKRVKNKFVTEFTNNGSLKITFGPGIRNAYGTIPSDAAEFTRYMMSRMEANDYLGVLPEPNTTMFILYRVGGGDISNIGANTLKTITYLNMRIDGNCDDPDDSKKKLSVKQSMTVNNPTPSYGGKDAPSEREIKYLIKYNSAMQGRCVTLKDYYARISQIHPKYGTPFRHSVVEENNKVVVYTLGLDHEGKLMSKLSEAVAENIKEYLRQYKMVNDFVEIRSGRVVNVAFDCYIFVDKAYDNSEVIQRVINLIGDYMDIRRHVMGENIFLGDLEKEISKLDGVVNLIALRCYNKVGYGYSDSLMDQTMIDFTSCTDMEMMAPLGGQMFENEVDLMDSDKTLYSTIDSMFEIKYLSKDVRVFTKPY